MLRIGIIGFQGSVSEHMHMLSVLGTSPVLVKSTSDLQNIDGIILPGGESTVISKLLKEFELFEPLQKRIKNGLPAWGTCAGMILLAKEITGEPPHLAVMDIRVRRNAYGRQINSFSKKALIPKISTDPIEMVFIRAPWIEKIQGTAYALSTIDGHIVAAQQDNMLVTSFHPELTEDLSVHRYFVSMVRNKNSYMQSVL